jgi:hypothetical protein
MTGISSIDALVVWTGVLAVLAGGAAAAWRATRGLRRLSQRVEEFVDDWQGIPGRPGTPGRPGVMERLARIEHDSRTVAHEVRTNGGLTLRDAVDRVERNQGTDPGE